MSDYALNSEKGSFSLCAADRKIILATQQGLPLVPQPFDLLSEQLGMTADEVIARMQRMLDAGIIRRIAAVPNHYKIGYKANGMTVWDVKDEYIQEVGKMIGDLSYVSHCYRRPRFLPEWPYNFFAMVHGRERSEVEERVLEMAEMLGDKFRQRDILYSSRILKKTGLRLDGGRRSGPPVKPVRTAEMASAQQQNSSQIIGKGS